MLQRIEQLTKNKVDFAIETTLSSRNYLSKTKEWESKGYQIVMVYFWSNNPNLAMQRIMDHVKKVGHSIPNEIVIRRYYRSIKNLFDHFIPTCDYWLIVDNSGINPEIVCEGIKNNDLEIINQQI